MVVRIDSVSHLKKKTGDEFTIVECSLPYRSDERFSGCKHLSPVFLDGNIFLPIGEDVEAVTESRVINGRLNLLVTGFEL